MSYRNNKEGKDLLNKPKGYCGRTLIQRRKQYEIEKAIASRLKSATREERKEIYKTMYDELFAKIPDHPRLTNRENPRILTQQNKEKYRLVRKFIDKSTVFVEFGPGNCSFSSEICKYARKVYGIDISNQRGSSLSLPFNFRLVIYNGYDLELQDNMADVVFSDQLIEHLHPDDTELHFQLVKRLLKPHGIYIFRTPHRFRGPRDISRFFSDKAEGFHLKEWSYHELITLIRKLKYSSCLCFWYGKKILIRIPCIYFLLIEAMLKILPKKFRKKLSKLFVPCVTMAVIK